MNRYFSILIYISIIFLFIYLIQVDYLSLGHVSFDIPLMALSLCCLFGGFIIGTICWQILLRIHNSYVSFPISIASIGLSIFSKYIPGKLWVVLGRAGYVSLFGYPIEKIALISLKAQLIVIWVGIVAGILPLFLFYNSLLLHIICIFLLTSLTLVLFNRNIHLIFIQFISTILRRKIQFPMIGFLKIYPALLLYIIYIMIWTIGFYFLCKSIYVDTPIKAAFAFPLAATIGIVAFIFPGGLGVREGIMIGYMSFVGVPVPIATTISVIARIWFIAGEFFIFVCGFISSLFIKSHKKSIYKDID